MILSLTYCLMFLLISIEMQVGFFLGKPIGLGLLFAQLYHFIKYERGALNLILLATIIFGTTLPAVAIVNGQLFSVRMADVQTYIVGLKGLLASTTASFAMAIAFGQIKMDYDQTKIYLGRSTKYFAVLFAISFLYMHSYAQGGFLFSPRAWNEDTVSPIVNTLVQAGSAFLFLYLMKFKQHGNIPKVFLIFLSFLAFIFFALKGARLDFISIFITVWVANEVVNNSITSISFRNMFLSALIFILFTIIGVWRFTGGISIFYDPIFYKNIIAISQSEVSWFVNGTFGDLATDLFGLLFLRLEGRLNFTYLEFAYVFIANSLPGISTPLYDYYIDDFLGDQSTAGGFMPIAQGYLAGGLTGVFILFWTLKSLHTWLYGWLSCNHNLFHWKTIVSIGVVSGCGRGYFYGLFGLYKGMLTVAIVLFVFELGRRLLKTK